MSKRYDKPTTENMGRGSSGTSMEREPMSEKKGQPSGSGVARGIRARGVDMCMGEAPSLKEFVPMADTEMGGRNAYGIGSGDGGASDERAGESGKGL